MISIKISDKGISYSPVNGLSEEVLGAIREKLGTLFCIIPVSTVKNLEINYETSEILIIFQGTNQRFRIPKAYITDINGADISGHSSTDLYDLIQTSLL